MPGLLGVVAVVGQSEAEELEVSLSLPLVSSFGSRALFFAGEVEDEACPGPFFLFLSAADSSALNFSLMVLRIWKSK